MKTEHDYRLIRCPKLGDEMTFAYCMREAGDLPCTRIARCWSPFFDVESFLEKKLTPEKMNIFIRSHPKDKVSSLIELIAAAKVKK
jgi:hypothetical protein